MCSRKLLDRAAPEYLKMIRAGKYVRYIWSTLLAWRGADPEGYFGGLGTWAEERMLQLEHKIQV